MFIKLALQPNALADNEQHEAFAQARFSGKSLTEAHYAAGYAGDKSRASKLSQLFEIKERIAELYREAATQTPYEKSDVGDLLTIFHTAPAQTPNKNFIPPNFTLVRN